MTLPINCRFVLVIALVAAGSSKGMAENKADVIVYGSTPGGGVRLDCRRSRRGFGYFTERGKGGKGTRGRGDAAH